MSERNRAKGTVKPRRDLTRALAALVLAATAAGIAGCRSVRGDEALAMFDVVADTPVPGFTTFCFSVATRSEVRTHHLVAPTSRRMTFGYYLPGPSGHVQVRAQAVNAAGEVVGEGLADLDIELGHTSAVVPLVVGGHEFTRNWCTPGGGVTDASPDLGPDEAGSDDGGQDDAGDSPDAQDDASDASRPDAQVDAPLDVTADGGVDGGVGGPTDARVDAAPVDVAVDAPPGSADAATDAPLDAAMDTAPVDAAVDRPPTPCTACTPGAKRTETETCGPCKTGKRSRTLTCSTTCTWTGDWGACADTGTAAHGCSIVDWCTRKAAPECKQQACTTAQALAECRTEAKSTCGSNSPAPTITNCN